MGRCLCYFAGRQDNQAFCAYAQSIGLRILPMLVNKPEISPEDDPALGPGCFLTYLANEELHPYGNPAGIGEATDPLLFLYRSYYQPPYLVMGQLHCSNDVPNLFNLIKPYFTKLAKWISKNWLRTRPGEYMGPEAQQLVEMGVKLTSLPPGVKVEQILLPRK